jgi:hypothetical protein
VRGQRHGPILKHGAVRGSPSKAVSGGTLGGGKNGGGGSASVVGGTTTCTGCNRGLSRQAEEKEFSGNRQETGAHRWHRAWGKDGFMELLSFGERLRRLGVLGPYSKEEAAWGSRVGQPWHTWRT